MPRPGAERLEGAAACGGEQHRAGEGKGEERKCRGATGARSPRQAAGTGSGSAGAAGLGEEDYGD